MNKHEAKQLDFDKISAIVFNTFEGKRLIIEEPYLGVNGNNICGRVYYYSKSKKDAENQIVLDYSVELAEIKEVVKTIIKIDRHKRITRDNFGLPQMTRGKTNKQLLPYIIAWLVISLIINAIVN